MTVHNEAQYIERSLRSVLPHVDEAIVADGAYKDFPCACDLSVDRTTELIHGLSLLHENIRVVSMPDRPTESVKRTRLLELARASSWILIVDGDEFLVGDIGAGLKKLCETTAKCLDVQIIEKHPDGTDSPDSIHWADGQPRLFMHEEGDHYADVHWGLRRADGSKIEPEVKLHEISIINLSELRSKERREQRMNYNAFMGARNWREE